MRFGLKNGGRYKLDKIFILFNSYKKGEVILKGKIIATIIVIFGCMFFYDSTASAADVPAPYIDINVNTNNGFKSYMGYKAITKTDSPQYMLQELCSTDVDGFRKCGGRYVIAVGTGVGGQVGDCVDLILTDGQVINCVIGDYKSNKHTDATNLIGKNGCCSEFIVDTALLRKDIKLGGHVECGYKHWSNPVTIIRRYNINFLLLKEV